MAASGWVEQEQPAWADPAPTNQPTNHTHFLACRYETEPAAWPLVPPAKCAPIAAASLSVLGTRRSFAPN